MVLHVRGGEGVFMLLAHDGKVTKVNTRSDFCRSPASYSAWHPNGRLIAMSFNSMIQFFHTAGNRRDVFVFDSDVALYAVETNRIVSSSRIADPARIETFPAWSPDGNYLYFSSAWRRWDADDADKGRVPAEYREVRFDLQRIRYDVASGEWGELETVLSAEETGKSILEPKVSPDGRYILVSMVDYGSFPVFHDSSDLYLIDLETRAYRPLPINSDQSDSWHSWSSNGRWIVFASKRGTGVFGRLYFAYVDSDGEVCKPFLLPQQDPRFYDTCLHNYNAPEFATQPVPFSQKEFLRAIYQSETLEARYDSVDGDGIETRTKTKRPGGALHPRME
jgi:Tol biopolymer transport system component